MGHSRCGAAGEINAWANSPVFFNLMSRHEQSSVVACIRVGGNVFALAWQSDFSASGEMSRFACCSAGSKEVREDRRLTFGQQIPLLSCRHTKMCRNEGPM